jgi:hypothetical protein
MLSLEVNILLKTTGKLSVHVLADPCETSLSGEIFQDVAVRKNHANFTRRRDQRE